MKIKTTKALETAVKIAGKTKIFEISEVLTSKVLMKIAKLLLPKEAEVRVGDKSCMILCPKIDIGHYLGYVDVEPGVDKVLHEKIKQGDTFVDVGAYIGYYSLLAYEIVGESGYVVSFEPNPESFGKLVRNIMVNGYNIIAENIALSDQEGYADFILAEKGSRFGKCETQGVIKVRTTAFDNYLKSHSIIPSFIKIDVEGAEYSVLKGMEETLSLYNPSLLVEIHHDADFELFDFLRNIGYSIYLVDEGGGVKHWYERAHEKMQTQKME